jgi:hypothetical protein
MHSVAQIGSFPTAPVAPPSRVAAYTALFAGLLLMLAALFVARLLTLHRR